MDIENRDQMEKACLCSVMYVGSGTDNCMIVEYSGCVDGLRWTRCGVYVA